MVGMVHFSKFFIFTSGFHGTVYKRRQFEEFAQKLDLRITTNWYIKELSVCLREPNIFLRIP